ncbi:MAG: hypothetical protein IT345_07665 [Trueperaceae bacterium]|nr:hypothetical protein [Trueperaceae bacterium]
MLKRFLPPVLLALAVVMSACSPQAVDASGDWSGSVQTGGASTPVAFTVGDDNRVASQDFHLEYGDQFLDYEVTSSVVGDRFSLDAHATSNAGTATLTVRAQITENTMTGTYDFLVVPTEGDTLHVNGSFTATRTAL